MSKKLYKTNYSVAVNWCDNNFVMCNNLPDIDPTIWDNVLQVDNGEDEETEDDSEMDIFQWFITDCNDCTVKYLMEAFPGLRFTYSDLLGLYVLMVDHYGTDWRYVSWGTTNEYAKAELGQEKKDL